MKSNNLTKSKKIASIIGICVATLLVVFAFCGRYLNNGLMQFGNFFLGSFGMAFYGIMAAIIVACACTLAGKTIKMPAKYVVFFVLLFISLVLFIHILTTTFLLKDGYKYVDFSTYNSYTYNYYNHDLGVPTFGGVVFGALAYAFVSVMTIYGASILSFAIIVLSVCFIGEYFYAYSIGKLQLHSKTPKVNDIEPSKETFEVTEAPVDEVIDSRQRALRLLFDETTTYPEEVSTQPSVEHFDVSPQSSFDVPNSTSNIGRAEAENILFGKQDLYEEKPQENTFFSTKDEQIKQDNDEFIVRGYYNRSEQAEKRVEDTPSWKIFSSEPEQKSDPTLENVHEIKSQPTVFEKQPPVTPVVEKSVDIVEVVAEPDNSSSNQDGISDDLQDAPFASEKDSFEDAQVDLSEEVKEDDESDVDDNEIVAVPTQKVIETSEGKAIQTGMEFVTRSELREKQESIHKYLKYNIPPYELLNDATIVDDIEAGDRKRVANAIVTKLAVFRIEVEVANIIVGPSVTRYMFNVLSQKTRMSEFKQYSDDIKACVEAQEDIRIEAPVHGTNQVGIEVANKVKTPVVLRSLLESKAFKEAKGNLVFAIGQEITGKVIVADLSDMPHLLIAGTTGSGKSVCLNCLIVSLMYKYGPEYVRFVMVDPKFVELSRYNGIPHMLTSETITTVNDALAGMDYLINEMEARYQLFRQSAVGNIAEYNKCINLNTTQKMPYLVFVVDELADLMAASKQAFESKLQRLAQKSRAAGIHIVLATQRPDVKTITGTIKANLPSRMALKVASQYDSNTIINCGGAEKLLGKGDMLFMTSSSPDLERVQGAYVSNDEIKALVQYSKEANEVYYDDKITDAIFVSRKQDAEALAEQEASKDVANKEAQLDPYCKKALRFWLEKQGGRASIASIQRNLGIGFNRAGRIMDSLQKLKYVEEPSASEPSSKPLRVLVTLEELDSLFPDMQD